MLNSELIKYGAANLDGVSVIHLSGEFESVFKLLQGQVTSDCSLVANQCAQSSSLCDEKGFILCNFEIVLDIDRWLILIDKESANIFLNEMEKYLPFYNVSAQEIKQEIIGICKQVSDTTTSNEHFIRSVGELSISIYIPKENVSMEPYKKLSILNWELNKKIMGDHIINSEDSGKYRPHELKQNLGRVSFNKGCFKGQEIIARMEYLGKSKKETQLLSYQSPDDILDFTVVGETFQNKNIFFSSCLGKKDFFKKNT